jgi:D-amino-acid dehydrogenase
MDPLGPLTIRLSYLPQALPWFMAAGRNALPARVRAITEARALLSMRAVADLEELLQLSKAADLLVKQDTLRVYDDEAQYRAEEGERRAKRAHGYETKRLSRDAAREIEPALSKDIHCAAFHGGWYFVRNPEKVVKSIAATVVASGGTIENDNVVQIETDAGRATGLRLASGRLLPVDRLVICAGAYSHLLARELGERILLEAERGYHIVLPNPGVSLSRSITYARIPGAATPMDVGLRLAGTDEFAGLEAAPNYARADRLWQVFKRVLPELAPPDAAASRWMGRRPGTPDSLPVISRAAHYANVWYGFGHGHMGLTWVPTTGRLIGEMMSGATPNIDLSPFRSDRF